MVFNATFNNISVISWQLVLLVEETGVPGENHRTVASHWQTLSHNIVSSTPRLSGIRTHNYQSITTTAAPPGLYTVWLCTVHCILSILYVANRSFVFMYNFSRHISHQSQFAGVNTHQLKPYFNLLYTFWYFCIGTTFYSHFIRGE